ncbi:DUF5327 family protein [Staphylococcus sp. Marseille-Q5304]|uniref:DUF5327 family protein n=1 Tax=Staphylococcus sp. Marseille-Q5304 TaxID=2942200 RepID=UPI002072F273|nr:DUF5327 family protein [Staphylococcus sp. Marseille-Q5304]
MEKEKMIQLIEQELVSADESTSEVEFEKHMYAIYKLTELIATDKSGQRSQHTDLYETPSSTELAATQPSQQQASKNQSISDAELKAMGAKVPYKSAQSHSSSDMTTSSNLKTDDGIGNGDSIFDF